MGSLEIIANITGFMQYFVPGYIFWTVYNFFAIRPRESTIEYLIIKSIAFSFILCCIIQVLSVYFPCIKSYVAMVLAGAALICGVAFGLLRKSRRLDSFLEKLFHRTFEEDSYLLDKWKNVENIRGVLVRLTNIEKEIVITGQLKAVRDYNNKEPLISIAYYKIYENGDQNPISNFAKFDVAEISFRLTAEWLMEAIIHEKDGKEKK